MPHLSLPVHAGNAIARLAAPVHVRTNQNTTLIKLLECVFMAIDHAGKMLFPSVLVCRCENAYYEAVQRRREGQLPEIKVQSDAQVKAKKQQPVQQVGMEQTTTARIRDSRRGTAGFDTYQSPNIYKFRKRGKLR